MKLRTREECRYFYLIGDDDSRPDSFLAVFFELEPYDFKDVSHLTVLEDPENVYTEAVYLLTKDELTRLLAKGNLDYERPSRAFFSDKSVIQ